MNYSSVSRVSTFKKPHFAFPIALPRILDLLHLYSTRSCSQSQVCFCPPDRITILSRSGGFPRMQLGSSRMNTASALSARRFREQPARYKVPVRDVLLNMPTRGNFSGPALGRVPPLLPRRNGRLVLAYSGNPPSPPCSTGTVTTAHSPAPRQTRRNPTRARSPHLSTPFYLATEFRPKFRVSQLCSADLDPDPRHLEEDL